jgi:hypothetical protein
MPRTYNLFRQKADRDVFCAVPEDRAVPAFLTDRWEFGGKINHPHDAPPGFDPGKAELSARLNGFYVFQRRPVPTGLSSVPGRA